MSVFVIIGAYLNMENPLLQKLSAHNKEMVMGFATLVENRDGNTGGHIRRTTTYVEMLAKELKNKGLYKDYPARKYLFVHVSWLLLMYLMLFLRKGVIEMLCHWNNAS